ncbi:YncE family protein [Fulvivirgaceae bacterium BMA12]|uniref:YncE family protein n=1 Tax=Agaribacillus aureus TaxID=3051825 RepID=A0ABT8KYV8_9BACT|nr:YncE family protein [Fulvivirgaceae bacterium BMA12]
MKKIPVIFIYLILYTYSAVSQDYYVYTTAESEDEVALIKFDGKKAEAIKRIPVGVWPAEIEGPHGITVSPDGKFWYLTMAHGNPYGTLYKFSTETNEVVGQTTLGLFPATMQISKATGFLYCVNFNLHGDMVPSTVSVVDPETMTEIKQITTGAMPHGSRISPDGLKHYSVAMMSGELFEIDAISLQVSRVLNLDDAIKSMAKDHANMDHSKMDHSQMDHSKMEHENDKMKGHKMVHSNIKPTWVIPHPDGKKVYVAGNGSNEILEVDLGKWMVTKRFPGDKGPYNVEVTPDGNKMIVTYKSAGSTGVWDLNTGKEVARIKNNRRVSHGIAISPDSRYAFVSIEGIGGEPGSVDVLDLEALKIIDTAEIGKQAGGIYFWKIEHDN